MKLVHLSGALLLSLTAITSVQSQSSLPEIQYFNGSQPWEFIDEGATVFVYSMGQGEAPGANAINDKNFAVSACASKRMFVSKLFQFRKVAGGSAGVREYLVTCAK